MEDFEKLKICINILKEILKENPIKNAKIDETIDFGDPFVIVLRPNGDRINSQAPGYFKMFFEKTTPRKYWFNKYETDEIATLAIFRNCTLDIYCKKNDLKQIFKKICTEYTKRTKLEGRYFDSN